MPKRERHLPRVLEWRHVQAAVAAESHPRDRAILALLAFAGLRRGEVMAASAGDYSRESRSLRVRGKGSKDRVVPLHVVAIGALDTYLASRDALGPRDSLFVSWRGRIGKRPIINAVARAGRRLGLRLHPHLFRHTFATELLNCNRAPQPPRRPPRHPDAPRARVARDHRGLHPRQPRSAA